MPKRPAARSRILRIARDRLGYKRLRPGQEAAIASVLEGRDTLVVLPTGAGKSAIYQIAGLLLPGPTVVVTPLLALQYDQATSIEDGGFAEAALVNSTISPSARMRTFTDLEAGRLEFVFLAPEQFGREETLVRLRDVRPSLLVVDEAHCISQWGYDFRPEYLRLGAVAEEIGRPPILALTATASPSVRDEIVERLAMREPHIIVRGFDRPNIRLGVERFDDEAAKARALLDRVAESEKPGIVYVATRGRAGALTADLCERGVKALAYHAGMAAKEREAGQEAFMSDEAEVIVATAAFCMGIDKPNVRFVFHYEISDALDSYHQEIGRAGRDGGPAEVLIFYRPEDLGIRRFFAGRGRLDVDQVERVAEAVGLRAGAACIDEVQAATGLSEAQVITALTALEEVDAVAILASGAAVEGEEEADPQEAVAAAERRDRLDQSRVDMMRGYAETRGCRRQFLLNYLGEPYSGPCGNCDCCEAGVQPEESARPFPLNSRVRHRSWGEGTVVRYEGDRLTALFEEAGYRTLALDVALEDHLLERMEERQGRRPRRDRRDRRPASTAAVLYARAAACSSSLRAAMRSPSSSSSPFITFSTFGKSSFSSSSTWWRTFSMRTVNLGS